MCMHEGKKSVNAIHPSSQANREREREEEEEEEEIAALGGKRKHQVSTRHVKLLLCSLGVHISTSLPPSLLSLITTLFTFSPF